MRFKLIIYLVLFFTAGWSVKAQNEEIRIRQRAIFIYNFAQQISWSNSNELRIFTIGVMGEDPVFDELQKMQRNNRTVKGKPMKILRFRAINDIGNAQLVFVHKKYNFDISDILRKVRRTNTLIVSEDYGFNESMINMIEIDGSFQFEINETRLNQENFTVSPSLRRLAITTASRWQELYEQSTQSLKEEREKVAQQQELLEQQDDQLRDQQTKIREQISQIDARNLEVERLRLEFQDLESRNKEQQALYDSKIGELDELETQLLIQQEEIDAKRDDIVSLDKKLAQQKEVMATQSVQIKEQINILKEQREELTHQRKFTVLFVILSILALVTGFVIWYSYRMKQRTNVQLAKKNEAIRAKSEELEDRNREMEEFAYVVSHDLQEPLNTITSVIDLINADQLDDFGKEGIKFMSDSSSRMRQLIRGLLEYSQLGKNVEFSKVDCNVLLDNVKANMGKAIQDSNVSLKVGELPVLLGYEVQLTLLFQNLISNAIKFKKKDIDPEIIVRARETSYYDKPYWLFSVQDNGIGIEEEYKEKIFTIFQRIHARDEYEGTGIGLAHCKKIVDLHGGQIWVESTPGIGSRFFFTISAVV